MAALQLLGMEWRPRASPEGTPRRGDRAAAGMPGRAYGTLGCPHPATGSHLPAEDTAPPFAVAFRVVAPCPAPQKPHTPPCPTTGFRLIQFANLTLGKRCLPECPENFPCM